MTLSRRIFFFGATGNQGCIVGLLAPQRYEKDDQMLSYSYLAVTHSLLYVALSPVAITRSWGETMTIDY